MTQEDALKLMKMGKNIFLTGAAGSGKTYVINKYIEYLKENKVKVAITASTGIAATHIGGMTIHSWSGIGIKDTLSARDLDFMEQKQYLWKRFEKTKVLIIDEISMLSGKTLDTLDQVCQTFKHNAEPFGGIQVILSGDFFQLPPIQKREFVANEFDQSLFDDQSQEEYSSKHEKLFAFHSDIWETADFHTCYLTEQHRQDDNVLLSILDSIRSGEPGEDVHEHLKTRISNEDKDITKLYTHNRNVDSVNNKKLQSLDGEKKVFKMTSKGSPNMCDNLKRGCLSPEFLELKEGAVVMFVKNNHTVGYVNGTCGIVIDFEDGYPVVETKDGDQYTALPQPWTIEDNGTILAQIDQVPLKLAWAVTIHKSQGMTLDSAVIDLSQSFTPGQGYVALSRLKTLDGLYLRGINEQALEVHPEVLGFDKELRRQSEILSKRLSKTDKKVIDGHIKAYVEMVGGTASKEDISKVSTFDETKDQLLKGKNVKEIAEIRGISDKTIFGHIEKLRKEGVIKLKDIEHLKKGIPKKDFGIIENTFKSLKTNRLTPVFEHLKEKYSYDDLKVVRLFVE